MVNVIAHTELAWALNERAFTHKHTLDDNSVTAGKCGAIEAVVSAMKTHLNNAGVCEKGCGALINITANNGKCHCTHRTSMDVDLR